MCIERRCALLRKTEPVNKQVSLSAEKSFNAREDIIDCFIMTSSNDV